MKIRYPLYIIVTFISILSIAILIKCNALPADVKNTLRETGDNKSQFTDVINYYKGDKEKLQALYFLIRHMKNETGLYYEEDAVFLKVIDDMDDDSKIYTKQLDSLISYHLKENPPQKKLDLRYDINIITKDLLIENIDYSFKVWKEKPWCQQLSFDEFCEWILPYRIHDEPLQAWRKYMYEQLHWIEDSVSNPEDPLEVLIYLNKLMSEKYKYSEKINMPFLGGIDAWNHPAGGCENGYALMTMACRSIGLPVAIDFTFQYPNWPGSHSWMVLLNTDRSIIPFNGISDNAKFDKIARNPIPGHEATTIYRHTYSKRSQTNCYSNSNIYPENLCNPAIKLVTSEYKDQKKDDFQIQTGIKSHSIAFLYSFAKGTQSVAVAQTQNKNGVFLFKDIGYPGYYYVRYTNDSLIYHQQPFYWNGDTLNYLTPDYSKPITMKVFRKYNPKLNEINFNKETKYGVIQGSNDKYFHSNTTLYQVDSVYSEYQEIKLNNDKKYRYYRYLNDSNSIHIAEINFFKEFSQYKSKIKGKAFGFAEDRPKADYDAAFDDNIRTNCNSGKGSWVSLDAGQPIKLASVQLIARNHLNIVEPGDLYELFYFDKDWKSGGIKIAEHYHLTYHNIPSNTVYLLKNLSKGSEERIFTYDNKQAFQ